MLIANPIYDVVFKKLMENDKVAKFFISTLLNQKIEAIEVKPQEFTYSDALAGLAVYRLDFIATIKLDNGELKKVLIEIQKAKNHIDLMRFRRYLAEQYKKEDVIDNKKNILPITTIYILGFTLPEIESACIKVDRNYIDLINNIQIEQKSEFVEKLTHDCFIVQVDRITDRFQTKLDKLLSIFEQKHFIDDSKTTKTYNYQSDLDELNIITNILHYTGTDPNERQKLEDEEEAWRTVNAMFADKENEMLGKLNEKDLVIEQKDSELEHYKKLVEELKNQLDNKN